MNRSIKAIPINVPCFLFIFTEIFTWFVLVMLIYLCSIEKSRITKALALYSLCSPLPYLCICKSQTAHGACILSHLLLSPQNLPVILHYHSTPRLATPRNLQIFRIACLHRQPHCTSANQPTQADPITRL